MRQGKYVVRRGRFIHKDDMRKSFIQFFWQVGSCVMIWWLFLMALGLI